MESHVQKIYQERNVEKREGNRRGYLKEVSKGVTAGESNLCSFPWGALECALHKVVLPVAWTPAFCCHSSVTY